MKGIIAMKALILTNEFPPNIYGGAGVHVDYLTRELSKLVNVEVRCFGKQNKKGKNLSAFGVLSTASMYKNCPAQLKPVLEAMEKGLKFNAKDIDSDIVHCHTWYSMFGGMLAKILYGIPLVVTTHSLEPFRPWKREQLGRGYDMSSWIEDTAVRMADKVIAVSSETKKDILSCYDIPASKIKIIPNGIDTDEYQYTSSTSLIKKYGIDLTKPYVLFVGRITRQKGIIHLVNAIKHIDKDIQVVLCAGAPDTPEIEKEMQKGVEREKKKRKNIFWIREMVTKKTAIQLYSHAAVFCCPSIYEPFGIINLEAMACGTAVVASAVGGIKEVVKDGKTGLLVPLKQQKKSPFEASNPEKFAKDLAVAVNKVALDEKLQKSMGRAGRKRAEAVYSWGSIAKQVTDLYKKLI